MHPSKGCTAAATAPYGAYSLYGGALWDADGVAPVSCAEL